MFSGQSSAHRELLSAPMYFAFVAVLTACALGGAMLCRPSLAYSIRDTLGLEKHIEASAGSFYAARVAPIFEEHCTSCHGARRQKADLRLDSFSAAIRGGKHGPVIRPGMPQKSELVTRIILPMSHEKAMPPAGKSPLTPDDVTVVKLWIGAGASSVQPVSSIRGAPKPVPKIRIADIDEDAVILDRAPLSAAVVRLQERFPGVITYESRGSADLEVNASLLGSLFGDAELAVLTPLRDRVVRADLSGTAVSDDSAAFLGSMKRLRLLRLTNTKVSDVTIQALTRVNTLQSLTVVGTTAATENSLAILRSRGVRIYEGTDAREVSSHEF